VSTAPVLSSPEPGAAPDSMAAGQPALRQALQVFAENRLAALGLGMIVLIALFCFAGPHVWHTDQIHNDILNANQHPSRHHPLGTDPVGYDVLGRLMKGGQTSLEVAFGAAVLAVILGTLWGAIAGYVGGVLDGFMMRIVDALLAIPALFLLLFLAAVTTPSVWMLIFVLGGIAWLAPARLVRGEVLTLRTSEYVQATRVMGGGPVRIVLRHIVPNTIGVVVVNATFQVADAILLVAYVSYLGLGAQPPATDWGGMLSAGLTAAYSGRWWLIMPPGLAIILVVCAFNAIGDGLRDAFDVRGRG
jgi:peptide/nickel transport system permease protein